MFVFSKVKKHLFQTVFKRVPKTDSIVSFQAEIFRLVVLLYAH